MKEVVTGQAWVRHMASGLAIVALAAIALAYDARAEGVKSIRMHGHRPEVARSMSFDWIPFYSKKEVYVFQGYLTERRPVGLRFSDDQSISRRPPSPALPEFTVMSHEYMPYFVETEVEDGRSLFSEVVIELEPHTIVSGIIEVDTHSDKVESESVEIVEEQMAILRSEEVLRYFETKSNSGTKKAYVPFAPARPAEPRSESSAEFLIEE